jgi:hypothetical protein
MACPKRALDPGPTIMVGWGIGSSRVTTPAARITVESPTERTALLQKFVSIKTSLWSKKTARPLARARIVKKVIGLYFAQNHLHLTDPALP